MNPDYPDFMFLHQLPLFAGPGTDANPKYHRVLRITIILHSLNINLRDLVDVLMMLRKHCTAILSFVNLAGHLKSPSLKIIIIIICQGSSRPAGLTVCGFMLDHCN